MAHEKRISRSEPGFVVELLDDSGSMAEKLPGTSDAKSVWVERYYGIILKHLLDCSTEVQGDAVVVKPRYYLSLIQYGSRPQPASPEVLDVEEAVRRYTEAGNSLGLGGRLGQTDAAAAFELAHECLAAAVADERFRNSFPPMLFHLTDGMSQTDARAAAEQVKQLATGDGHVLVVNAYIGTQTSLSYAGPHDFPGYVDAAEAGSAEDNLRLFEMSSVAPECICQNLIEDNIFPKFRPGSRLFFDVRTKEMLKHVIQVVGSLGSRADRMQPQ